MGQTPQIRNVEIADDAPDQTSATQTQDGPDGSLNIIIGGQREKPKAKRNVNFDENLAERIDQYALDGIAERLLEGIDADLQSRSDWEETANQAANYLGIKLKEPNSTVAADGTVCQSVATCMLEAAVKLWGVARGELLPSSGPVKVRRDKRPDALNQQPPAAQPLNVPPGGIAGPEAQQQPQVTLDREALADALEMDLNHYLTVTDREYYPDFSKMLLSRAVIGNAFRKVYRCPLRRRPTSAWVKAEDMIISNDCSHLSGAGRVTERIRIRQGDMRRLMVSGHYRDVALVMPTGQPTKTEEAVAETEGVAAVPQLPDDQEHMVYECYCELGSTARASLIGDLSLLDLDENGKKVGYPLPYRVSIDVDSREVLEIRRNWKRGDADHRPRQRYVKYGFIPGLGFWDLGLIHLVGNPTQAATMLQRAGVDASLVANFPAFVMLKGAGARQMNTVIRPGPGEAVVIDGGGASDIRNVIMGLPYKEPSPQSIALATKLESDVKRLAGTIELPIGEGRTANIPVGTIMAMMESVSMVPGAVHKDDHIAQAQEFELLRELFAEDPDALTQGNKSPARRWQTAEEILDPDLVPAADPNTPSQLHRLMKLQALTMAGGMPQFRSVANNRAIWQRIVRWLAEDNPQEFTLPEQPSAAPPDPKVASALINQQTKQADNQIKLQVETTKAQAKATELAEEAQQRELDRQSEERRAVLAHASEAQKQRDELAHDAVQQGANRVHEAAQQFADHAVDHAQHRDTHGLETAKFAADLFAPEPAKDGGE